MSHFTVAVFTREDKDSLGEVIDDVEALLEPFCEDVEPGSEYAEFIEDDDCDFDECAGKRGYWTNPDAKWDWYSIGGRWDNSLRLLNGETANTAPVRNCVFDPDDANYQRALRFWEVVVEKRPLSNKEKQDDFFTLYKPEYYIDQFRNKENYAKIHSAFYTYAFITADGEWNEPGQMGWFGCADTTAESREEYYKCFEDYMRVARDENMSITIVDCHI